MKCTTDLSIRAEKYKMSNRKHKTLPKEATLYDPGLSQYFLDRQKQF